MVVMPDRNEPTIVDSVAPLAPRRRWQGISLVISLVTLLALAGTSVLTWAVPRGQATVPPASKSETPDWKAVSAAGFGASAEARRLSWIAGGNGLTEEEVRSIGEQLDGTAHLATRAAVLLGAAADLGQGPSALAQDILLRRLSARQAPASRSENGVDIVAARALAPHLRPGEPAAAALAELASGDDPHPDLAVRVECARAALEFAQAREVAPFLLAVLRAETPGEAKSPRTWPRVQTLAWVKTRAAEALSRAGGTDMRFRPDGSWAHQTAEADRLEGLLLARPR